MRPHTNSDTSQVELKMSQKAPLELQRCANRASLHQCLDAKAEPQPRLPHGEPAQERGPLTGSDAARVSPGNRCCAQRRCLQKCRANRIATLATLGVNEPTHCFKHNSNPKNIFDAQKQDQRRKSPQKHQNGKHNSSRSYISIQTEKNEMNMICVMPIISRHGLHEANHFILRRVESRGTAHGRCPRGVALAPEPCCS